MCACVCVFVPLVFERDSMKKVSSKNRKDFSSFLPGFLCREKVKNHSEPAQLESESDAALRFRLTDEIWELSIGRGA